MAYMWCTRDIYVIYTDKVACDKVRHKSASDIADLYKLEKEKGDRWAQKLPQSRKGIRSWLHKQLRVPSDLYIAVDVCDKKGCTTLFRGEHASVHSCPNCNTPRYETPGDPTSGSLCLSALQG